MSGTVTARNRSDEFAHPTPERPRILVALFDAPVLG